MQISMQKQQPAHNVVPFAHFLDPEEGLDTCLEEMNRSAVSFLCQMSHKVSSLAFTGKMSSKSYQLGRRRWKLEIMNLRLLLLKRVLWNNIDSISHSGYWDLILTTSGLPFYILFIRFFCFF